MLALLANAMYICRAKNDLPAWRNWQTRMVQDHVGATPWRFESSRRHKKNRLF